MSLHYITKYKLKRLLYKIKIAQAKCLDFIFIDSEAGYKFNRNFISDKINTIKSIKETFVMPSLVLLL